AAQAKTPSAISSLRWMKRRATRRWSPSRCARPAPTGCAWHRAGGAVNADETIPGNGAETCSGDGDDGNGRDRAAAGGAGRGSGCAGTGDADDVPGAAPAGPQASGARVRGADPECD